MFELVAFVVIARMKTRNEFICSPEKPEVRRRGRWRWRGRRRHGRRQRAAETAAAAAAWCAAAALLAAGGARAERFTLGYITGSQRRENNPTYQRPGLVISGAISMAVDEVNEQLLGPMGHELGFVIAETYGQEEDSIRQVAELWAANVSGYIGPQETCVHEGRMAAAFNLPMISYYCRDVECSNKSVYPTFARTRPPDAAISHSVVAVLAHFRFMHVVFVYLANANNDFSRLAAAIMDAARAQNIAVQAVRSYRKPYYHDSYSPNPFLDIVRETYKDTRVYVSIGHYHDHIGLMLALDAQHLLDKGEYVAVGVDIEQYAAEAPHTYLTGPLRDRAPVEPRTLLAFRSYLAVAPSPAAAFPAFARRVNRRLLLPPFRNVSLAAAPSAATVSPPVAKEVRLIVYLTRPLRDRAPVEPRTLLAFRSYLAVAPSPAAAFPAFARRVNRRLLLPPFRNVSLAAAPSAATVSPPVAKEVRLVVYLTRPLRDRAPVEPRTLLAFRSYLAVAPSPAAAFPAFARRVNRRLLLPPFRNVSLAAAPSAATVSPPVAKEVRLVVYLTRPLRDRAPVEPRTLLAFCSYLAVAPSPAAAFPAFARRVNRRLLLPPFRNVSLAAAPSAATVSPPVAKEIPVEAAWLHDAVWTYARALAAQLRAHAADPNDGRALAARMRDTTYNSCMGYLVHMDSNGDAVGNYTLLGLDPARPPGLYPLATLAHASHTLPELKPLRDFQWVGGKPPLSEPVCGFRGEKCVNHVGEIGAGVAGGALILLVLAALALYRGWRYEQELDSLLWKIDFRDVRLARGSTRPDRDHPAQHSNNINNNSQQGSHPPVRTSQVSLSSNPDLDFRYSGVYCELVLYRGRVLALKRVHKQSVDITREMKKELKAMRDIQHDNVNAFVGACTEPPNVCVISDYCTRGSLKDILDNDDFKLDNMFVASLVGDIIRGMIFLHESPIQFHGALKPANCLVDSRWVLKLTDFGLRSFRRGELPPTDAHAVRALMDGLVYCAPEHLRAAGWGAASGARAAPAGGSPAGDVYSFALVLYELHTRQGAFGAHAPPPEDLLALVASAAPGHTPYRPPLEPLESCFEFVRECCCECWAEEASARPDFKTVRTRLRPLRKGMKPNIFDNMMAMMEKYANNLEALVDERTDLLQEEKKKTEALLVEMLPAPVAEQLKRGLRVLPESFSCVTIYFSDIVGFTAMSAESTPLQVVDFLNDLYTCFDSILESFDVYKVETIGDAYMVVSGLPLRNGWAHAGEVASMALALLSATRAFRVRHRPDHRLMLRVGLHSGPVCAGVVGLKMPRYCLFGDTVNTASRFESTGAPLKIHCSAACKRILDKLGGYHLEERGIVPMKGKRDQLTYWLKGEDATAASLRAKLRAARKANSAKGTPVLADKRDAKGPRSSLKNKNWRNQLNSLHRCCSLESPKKLRFASGSLLESHTDSVLHHRSDEYLMEVFADSRYSNKQGATHLEPPTLCYDHTSTSCPIIEHSDEHLSPPPAPPAASLSCDLLDTRYRPPSPSPSPPPTARTADIKLVINGHSFGDPHGESAVPLLADV